MISWKTWGLLCLGLCAATSSQAGKLAAKDVDLGEVAVSSDVIVPVTVSNPSNTTVTIGEIRPMGSRDTATIKSKVLEPGASTTLEIHLDLAQDGGFFRRRMAILTDKTEGVDLEVVVSGYAWSPFSMPTPGLDIGPVDLMEPLKSVRWELPTTTEYQLKITGVKRGFDYLDTRVIEDGRVLEVTPKASIPRSRIAGFLIVSLVDSAGVAYDAPVAISGTAFGQVAPNSDSVTVGLFESDKPPQRQISVISDRMEKPVEITKIDRPASVAATRIRECVKKDKACKMIEFDLAKGGRTGRLYEEMLVHVKGQDKPVSVYVSGLRVAPGTKIVNLDNKVADAAKTEGEAPAASQAASGVPLIQQMRQASEPPPPPAVLNAEPGDGPLLKWQVEQEKQAYAYAIFRADAENGPFVRVNKSVIKRISADSSGASYAWRDNTAKPGNTYWYFITTLYEDGHRERLSPIVKKSVAAR